MKTTPACRLLALIVLFISVSIVPASAVKAGDDTESWTWPISNAERQGMSSDTLA